MEQGYYQFDNEKDVQAYIAKVLQPKAVQAGSTDKFVYLERCTYDIFPVRANEYEGYSNLKREQKQELYNRFQKAIESVLSGSIVDLEIKAFMRTKRILGTAGTVRAYSLQIELTGVPNDVEISSVNWEIERAPETGAFDTLYLNRFPDGKAYEAVNKGNADVTFPNSRNWVKYKWHDTELNPQDIDGARNYICLGYEGAAVLVQTPLLVKATVVLNNGVSVPCFGFVLLTP